MADMQNVRKQHITDSNGTSWTMSTTCQKNKTRTHQRNNAEI